MSRLLVLVLLLANLSVCFGGSTISSWWLNVTSIQSKAFQNPILDTDYNNGYFPDNGGSPLIFGNTVDVTLEFVNSGSGIGSQIGAIEAGTKYRVWLSSPNGLVSFSPEFLDYVLVENETVVIDKALTTNIWAQNPSAAPWFAPDGLTWTPDSTAVVPATNYPWTAFVACILPNGTDCAPAPCTYALVDTAFNGTGGFCFQPVLFYEPGGAVLKSPIAVAPRFLTLEATNTDATLPIALGSTTIWEHAEYLALPNVATSAFILSLPLDDTMAQAPVEVIGVTTNKLRQFYPGKDNNGGTITVDVWKTYVRSKSTGTYSDTSAVVVDWFNGKQQLSYETTSLLFTVKALPGGADVESYRIYFRVSAESNPSVITPTNVTQNSSQGVYNSGAYVVPFLEIIMKDAIFATFVNFPPTDGTIYITTVVPPPALYTLRLEYSPADLNVLSISLPFTVTPPGALRFFVGGVEINPATGFVFSGYQRVVQFGIATQSTATSGVSFTFGTPIVSGGPPGGLLLTLPPAFSFAYIAGSDPSATSSSSSAPSATPMETTTQGRITPPAEVIATQESFTPAPTNTLPNSVGALFPSLFLSLFLALAIVLQF